MHDHASPIVSEISKPRAPPKLPAVLGKLLSPLPLFPLQFILSRIVHEIARRRPELFERLGPHTMSTYAIDVVELPFILLLRPDPLEPKLSAHRRSEHLYWDARICGPFNDLFRIIDGRGDSDAMFFSGSVRVTGDTEAAVCLRNALDDLEGSIIDDLLKLSGPFFLPAQKLLDYWRGLEPAKRQ